MGSTKLSVKEWRAKCQKEQESISRLLSNRLWDKFVKGKEDKYLFQKLALPLFGLPKKNAEDFGLNSEQKKIVHDIMDKCFECSVDKDNVFIAVIFVFVRVSNGPQTFVPLVRVMKHVSNELEDVPNNVFIDHMGGVYESWLKYLEDNTWDMSWLCVPKNGYYSSEYGIEFIDQSKRGNRRNLVLKNGLLNTSENLLLKKKGSDSSSLSSELDFDGDTKGAIVSAGTENSACSQFESQADEEKNWLSELTNALSFVTDFSTDTLQTKAKEGEIVSATTRTIVNALNIGKLCMRGFGRIFSPENNTRLEMFASVVFFFTHDVPKYKSASRIFEDAQDEKIETFRDILVPENRPAFDAIRRGTKDNVEKRKVEQMREKADFIKEMGSYEFDLNEYYSQFKLLPNGLLNINDELMMHPRAYTQMLQSEKIRLLRLSKELKEGKLTPEEFDNAISTIQNAYRIRFNRQRQKGLEYLKEKFNVSDVSTIDIGGKQLGKCKPEELDRLENVVRSSFRGDLELIKVVNAFAKKLKTMNVREYCAAGEYAVRKVETEVTLLRQENRNPTRERDVTERDHYKSMTVKKLLEDEETMNHLVDDFNNLRRRCDAANVGSPTFENSMAMANHYDKHSSFPKIDPHNNLSPERYFEIATEMAGGPITDIKWTQDGSSLCCTFTSEKYGATSIRYDDLANKTSVIATLFANKLENQIALIK